MNLMKLFNFNYLMQNIKKSKMAIILFLAIVPIFTALTIILNSSYYYALEFYELGLANILFMYVTPFILSFSLFGYVFKKKDIDFMCSMPISRKSLFVTNTIGGIALILISQFITFAISGLLGLMTDTVVFTGMIWDLFLYQSLAYIFVFTAANLAMAVSGNVITQIVVTALILFLIPATIFYSDLWQGSYYDLVDGNYTVNLDYTIRSVRTYTAPSLIFGAVNSYWQYEPSVLSTIKMIVLSVLYSVIGYFMFEKKKMENAGESFEKSNTHFLVKALTLVPFAMILAVCIEDGEWQPTLFLIAIVAVYYFIYDLVTNKKHKFWKSVAMMALSLVVTTCVYGAIAKVADEVTPKIEMDDIKSITIDQIAYNMYGLNYEITDKEIIETLLYEGGQYSYYSSYDSSFKSDVAITIQSDAAYRNRVRIWVTLNMKNGREMNTRVYVSEAFVKDVIMNTTYAVEDVGIVQYKEAVEFTPEEEKALKNAINRLFAENEWVKLYEILNGNYNDTVKTYKYEDHDIKRFFVPIETTSEIFELITKAENRSTAEFTRKRRNLEIYLHIDMNNAQKEFYYYGDCPTNVKDYVINHKEDICNKDAEYITLVLDGNKFYTNDVDTIFKLIKESKEYKSYIEEGYGRDYDKIYYEPVYNGMTPLEEKEMIYPEATSTSTITVID